MTKWIFLPLFFMVACSDTAPNPELEDPIIQMSNSVFGQGTLALSGTISLPLSTPTGLSIQLEIDRNVGEGGGSQIQGAISTTSTHEVKYSISNLPSGDYQLKLSVDTNQDGFFGESGDLEGWYAGTLISPIQNQGAATFVDLASVDRSGVDFGISALP